MAIEEMEGKVEKGGINFMSMGAVDLVEEIVPYLGLDLPNLVPFSCGGALHAPMLASGCAVAV